LFRSPGTIVSERDAIAASSTSTTHSTLPPRSPPISVVITSRRGTRAGTRVRQRTTPPTGTRHPSISVSMIEEAIRWRDAGSTSSVARRGRSHSRSTGRRY